MTNDPTSLTNPYAPELLAPGDELIKTTVYLSGSDAAFLEGLYTKRGWKQSIVAQLIKSLIHELKSCNLTSYDPARFKLKLESSAVVFERDDHQCPWCSGYPVNRKRLAPVSGPSSAPETIAGDDGRGAEPLARGDNRFAVQSANFQRTSEGGDRRPGGEAIKQEEKGSGATARPKRVLKRGVRGQGGDK